MKLSQLSLPAPAKLNLFLHITGRRADGYHNLQTLFQLLDYSDTIDMKSRDDGKILLHSEVAGVSPKDNLVYRAALALQKASGTHLGAELAIHKRLPFGGGLGGGSSDAATTLVGLNRLWQTDLKEAALAELGLALGADVPVFVRGQSAWAEGVGESLQNVVLPQRWYLVIDPGVSVSTAAIFADKDLTRNTQPITLAAFLKQGGHNDCEPVTRRLFAPVNEALEWLSSHGQARLTGTGGCIFAAFSSRQGADSVAGKVPARWRWFVARGVEHSPLHRALKSAPA